MEQFKGQPRLPKFAVPKRYSINLTPDLTSCKFSGSVSVDLDIVSDTSFIVLNAADLSVLSGSVSFTGPNSDKFLQPSKVETFEDDEILVLEFQETLPIGGGVLDIGFEGILSDKMKGFYRSTYEHKGEKKNMAVTQFEPVDARRCFPCWDEPACKATFKITLSVPSDLVALSKHKPISLLSLRLAFEAQRPLARSPVVDSCHQSPNGARTPPQLIPLPDRPLTAIDDLLELSTRRSRLGIQSGKDMGEALKDEETPSPRSTSTRRPSVHPAPLVSPSKPSLRLLFQWHRWVL